MQMRLRHIEPLPQLKGIINKMWLFESSGRAPAEDMKLIVPNGMAKLTIPFRNGVSGKNKDYFHLSKESQITLIGIQDIPAVVDVEHDAPHGNIGIEFSPAGMYRIFQLRHCELKNKLFLLEEIMGKSARVIQEIIADTEMIDKKVQLIQGYLVRLLSNSRPDTILDYCIGQIAGSNGLVTVTELERKTGYSSRWLYEKFIEKVGLGPKNLSSIVRFNQIYEQWAKNPGADVFKEGKMEDIYDYFYDQAHFIKDFKRFTGFPPLKFARSENDFGRIFYKDQ
jgi:AraC-like DNA-binding protein